MINEVTKNEPTTLINLMRSSVGLGGLRPRLRCKKDAYQIVTRRYLRRDPNTILFLSAAKKTIFRWGL